MRGKTPTIPNTGSSRLTEEIYCFISATRKCLQHHTTQFLKLEKTRRKQKTILNLDFMLFRDRAMDIQANKTRIKEHSWLRSTLFRQFDISYKSKDYLDRQIHLVSVVTIAPRVYKDELFYFITVSFLEGRSHHRIRSRPSSEQGFVVVVWRSGMPRNKVQQNILDFLNPANSHGSLQFSMQKVQHI